MNFRCAVALLTALAPLYVQAQAWQFAKPVNVTHTGSQKIFHHLESSGRHNIAVSADTVAIAWEDNRDGTPRIYMARKNITAKQFSADIKISGSGEAYEPSLVALDNNRFALAWEEDARIYLRIVTPTGLGTVIALSETDATQSSLSRDNNQLTLVYSRRDGRFGRIWIHRIEMEGNTLLPKQNCAVDSLPLQDEQLYPAVVNIRPHTLVAWEDRRPGHTIIMAAKNDNSSFCHFSSPQRISEGSSAHGPYGKGHGVARVALANYGAEQVLAVWADKRDYRESYDIYSAHYQPGNKPLFGPNIKVQDSFGGFAQQWHASVAGHPSNRLIVAWDDKRDGDSNVMLSWLEDFAWSDDVTVPGASGAGEQNHPTIILDDKGNIHLAWIERKTVDGQTQLRYLYAKAIND